MSRLISTQATLMSLLLLGGCGGSAGRSLESGNVDKTKESPQGTVGTGNESGSGSENATASGTPEQNSPEGSAANDKVENKEEAPIVKEPEAVPSVAISELSLLSPDGTGGVLGLNESGAGLTRVQFTSRTPFAAEVVGVQKQFSIRDNAHVLYTDSGVSFVSGTLTADAAAASTPVPYAAGFSATDKVIAAQAGVTIQEKGGEVAIYDSGLDQALFTTLPADFGDIIGAGKARGAEAYWFLSATKLAYYGSATAGEAMAWSDAIDVDVAAPLNQTTKSVFVDISFTGGVPNIPSSFYVLTDANVFRMNTADAGSADSGSASQTEVGSN